MPIYGIDFAHHQGDFSLQGVRDEGFQFAICKLTQGSSYSHTDYHREKIREADNVPGLIPGAYHFLEKRNDSPIPDQVDYFLNNIPDGPKGKIIAVDFEEYSGNQPDATDLWNFCNELRSRIGDQPVLIYTADWYVPGTIGNVDFTPLRNQGFYLWSSNHWVTSDGDMYASSMYQQVPDEWWTDTQQGFDQQEIMQIGVGRTDTVSPVDLNAYRQSFDRLQELTQNSPVDGSENSEFIEDINRMFNNREELGKFIHNWTWHKGDDVPNLVNRQYGDGNNRYEFPAWTIARIKLHAYEGSWRYDQFPVRPDAEQNQKWQGLSVLTTLFRKMEKTLGLVQNLSADSLANSIAEKLAEDMPTADVDSAQIKSVVSEALSELVLETQNSDKVTDE